MVGISLAHISYCVKELPLLVEVFLAVESFRFEEKDTARYNFKALFKILANIRTRERNLPHHVCHIGVNIVIVKALLGKVWWYTSGDSKIMLSKVVLI